MITTVTWHKGLAPGNDDLVVDHEPQESVQVLSALPMGPDVLYTYLIVGTYSGEDHDGSDG